MYLSAEQNNILNCWKTAKPQVASYEVVTVYNCNANSKPLFADKSAAWQAFILTYSQIKITLLN